MASSFITSFEKKKIENKEPAPHLFQANAGENQLLKMKNMNTTFSEVRMAQSLQDQAVSAEGKCDAGGYPISVNWMVPQFSNSAVEIVTSGGSNFDFESPFLGSKDMPANPIDEYMLRKAPPQGVNAPYEDGNTEMQEAFPFALTSAKTEVMGPDRSAQRFETTFSQPSHLPGEKSPSSPVSIHVSEKISNSFSVEANASSVTGNSGSMNAGSAPANSGPASMNAGPVQFAAQKAGAPLEEVSGQNSENMYSLDGTAMTPAVLKGLKRERKAVTNPTSTGGLEMTPILNQDQKSSSEYSISVVIFCLAVIILIILGAAFVSMFNQNTPKK